MSTRPINLQDPTTFKNESLSKEQFHERYQILQALEESLDSQSRSLSPKTVKELGQLTELAVRERNGVLNGSFPICRLSTPHYFVKFGETNVDRYKLVGNQIQLVPRTGLGVIQAVQPRAIDNWFRQSILMQVQAVLRSDFMDALRNAFIANMCLLNASTLLVKEPAIFREVLELYGQSHDLYETQIAYNRKVELRIIENAEETHQMIEEFHTDIARICGSSLEEKAEILEGAARLHEDEVQKSLQTYTALKDYCDQFLIKIDSLEQGVTSCIDKISNKHEKVVKALGKINALMVQRQLLSEKKNKIQQDFDEFQARKKREWDSRHEEREGGINVSILGIPIFSKAPDIKIVEADFHSKEAYDSYIQSKGDGERLERELEIATNDLKNSMLESGVMQYGHDRASIEEAIASLSGALSSIYEVKYALKQRRSQAETQIEACHSILRVGGRDTFHNVREVLGYLNGSLDKIVQKKSLWLESNRQSLTLQICRREEQGIRLMVTDGLARMAQDPSAIQSLQVELKKFVPKNTNQIGGLFDAKLVTNEQILLLTQGQVS